MSTAGKIVARHAKFEGVFTKIKDELIEHFSGEGMPQEAVDWYRNVCTLSIHLLNIHGLITCFSFIRASSTMFVAVNSFAACQSLRPSRFLKATSFLMMNT